jgi:SHS family lactate transporter-like MFS transporter
LVILRRQPSSAYALAHGRVSLGIGAFVLRFMVQGAWGRAGVSQRDFAWTDPCDFPGLAYQLGNLLASRISKLQARAAEHSGSYGRVLACPRWRLRSSLPW